MKSTWVLVADSSRARVFVAEKHSPLQEIDDFAHTEGRLHDREITSDLPGKDSGVVGGGGHAYQDQVEPKEQEAINFAKEISKYLDKQKNADKFSRLVVISEPGFLGKIRKQLSDQVRDAVCFELDKNITKHSIEDIQEHIPKKMI